MNPALTAVAVAVGAGAIVAVSSRDPRAALIGLAAVLVGVSVITSLLGLRGGFAGTLTAELAALGAEATPLAAVFLVIFLFLAGLFAFYIGGLYERNQADLRPFFQFHPWLYVFLVPAVSMRLWAEERRTGSIETLMCAPVRDGEVVIGKWAAAAPWARAAGRKSWPSRRSVRTATKTSPARRARVSVPKPVTAVRGVTAQRPPAQAARSAEEKVGITAARPSEAQGFRGRLDGRRKVPPCRRIPGSSHGPYRR